MKDRLRGRWGHDYVGLFDVLSQNAQADIASGLVVEGTQANVASLRELLGAFNRDSPFLVPRPSQVDRGTCAEAVNLIYSHG